VANIGISNSIYRIDTALSKANVESSKSMTRIATGSNSSVAGDRATISTTKNTFLLDISATQSAIKSINLVKGFLATAISTVDHVSERNTRLMELAIMGANATNTPAETTLIDTEAEDLIDDMLTTASTANYKGKLIFDGGYNVFISLGGRGQEKSVYVGTVNIIEIGLFDYITENLMVKPSDGLADTNALTSVVEVFQEKLNELRIGLASQYAAIEQAELSITDLNTQYRLGKDAIDDVNFTAEVAALAKSQILQDAANAMLIQANNAQRGLVALIS